MALLPKIKEKFVCECKNRTCDTGTQSCNIADNMAEQNQSRVLGTSIYEAVKTQGFLFCLPSHHPNNRLENNSTFLFAISATQ